MTQPVPYGAARTPASDLLGPGPRLHLPECPPSFGGLPPPAVRRLVLRSGQDLVELEDHGATAAELDTRAKGLMAWLRDTAPPLCPDPLDVPEPGRHHDPGATVIMPAIREGS